jgi:hypothetical protein
MDIQQVFDRMKGKKAEARKLKALYKDALAQSRQYQDIMGTLIDVKAKKQAIEAEIKAGLESEMQELERINADLAADNQLMSDLALSTLMRGETVEVKDAETDQAYEPSFSVRFKKGQMKMFDR